MIVELICALLAAAAAKIVYTVSALLATKWGFMAVASTA